METFSLHLLDYLAFGSYFVILCVIGFWVGRRERTDSDHYFLAGRSLPWYVVVGSFVASTITTNHFIGSVGAAFIYGMCLSAYYWLNIGSFSLLIWFFIPLLLAARVGILLDRKLNGDAEQGYTMLYGKSRLVAIRTKSWY